MERWGDFDLVEEIGRGGFGTVYRARHPTLGRDVALKLVALQGNSRREIEKALEEPRRLASVSHHHVVTVHDARYQDGRLGICMELVRGQSLEQLVATQGTYGAHEAAACIRTVANALAAVHRAGIVHNDVKARNVMREKGGRLVLMDFGAGRRLQDPNASTGLSLVGTPLYMAPEIFRLREPSPVSDIYSLGVLWFYLLTGSYPVEGTTLTQLADAHAAGRRRYVADLVDDVPGDAQHMLGRALHPDPKERYQSCGELLHDLDGSPAPIPHGRPLPDEPVAGTGRERSRTLGASALWKLSLLLVGSLVGITGLGFLGCQAYNVMFGLDGEFARESPLFWFNVGARTLPLPLYIALVALIGWLGADFVWRLLRRHVIRVDTWSGRTATAVTSFTRSAGIDDAASLATVVLLVQVLLVAALAYAFSDILTAVGTPVVEHVVPEHALLSRTNAGRWQFFRITMALLTLAGGYAWWHVARNRRAADMGFTRLTAGICVTCVSLLLTSVPWRLVHDADLETVVFDSERCFVTSVKGARLHLFCPGAATRSFAISADDPRLIRDGSRANVFATVAPAAD